MHSKRQERLINAAIALASVLLSWLALELAVWQFFPEKRDKILANMISADRRGTLTEGFFRNFYTYDPTYGWLPIANFEGRKWGHVVALHDHGIRSNGGSVPGISDRPFVLAIGDSYTFGDEVGDADTWPAIFERTYGIRVLNAGVSSFGLDQMVMRAETLAEVYKPELIAVTFIAGSHTRAGYVVRHGAYKPYFDLQNQELVLRNVPVPRQDKVDWLRYILGHSYVLHFPMHQFATEWWWRGAMWDFRLAGNDFVGVSCRLVERLRDFAAARNIALTFFFMVEEEDSRNDPSLPPFRACVTALRSDRVAVVDGQPFYVDLYRREPGRRAQLHNPPPGSHFTPEGNAIMARLQADAILPLLSRQAVIDGSRGHAQNRRSGGR